MTIPNVDGLALRAVTGMYSYDHDLASFVAIGSATVSEDGSTITSDAGAGVIKAGWHRGGNPSSTGSAGTCPTWQKCQGSNCVADNGQTPPQASPTDCKEQYCNGGGVANRNKDSETPTDVCKQCSNGSEENRSDGSTPADTNSCCFNGERLDKFGQTVGNVLDGPLEAMCPDRTQHSSRLHDVDGCSSPGPQPNDPMQIFPYPSGLLNQAPTAFGNPVGVIAHASAAGPQPCNQHDICYQSCATPGASLSATRQVCDDRMKSRMDNVCAAAYPSTCPASLGALQCIDYFLQRTDCYTYSVGYWTALRGAGFFAAYKARQEQPVGAVIEVSMRNIVEICLTALVFSTAMNCRAAPAEIGSLVGMRTAKSTIELTGMNTELRSVALGAQRSGLFLLVASRPDGQGVSESRLSIVSSDEAGRTVSTPVLPTGPSTNASASADPLLLASTNHLASDASGRPYLLTMALNGTMKLHRLSSQGQSTQVFDVALDLPAMAIRRFEAVADRGFLIVGSKGSTPVLIMVDTAGRVLSRVVVADEGAAAVAAHVSNSGDFIALVESANYVDPRFWVGRVKPDGSIAGRTEMAGKPLDLDVAPDGRVVVLVEQAGVAHRDVVAKGFDREFAQQWSRTVVANQANTTGFRVSALRKGGYFLAGKRDRGLWLSRIDASGVEIWSSWTDPRKLADLEMAVDVDLTSRGDEFAVAYTALVVRDRKQFGVVRTLQFRLE